MGMLWFDNDPKTDLMSKINRAADYYQKKYGHSPTLCFVNPKMLENDKAAAGSVKVKTNGNIMPGHLWIGCNGDED
jgi:hypothetical protein